MLCSTYGCNSKDIQKVHPKVAVCRECFYEDVYAVTALKDNSYGYVVIRRLPSDLPIGLYRDLLRKCGSGYSDPDQLTLLFSCRNAQVLEKAREILKWYGWKEKESHEQSLQG